VYFWKVFKAAKEADVVLIQDTVSSGFPAMLGSIFADTRAVVRVPGDYAWEQATQKFGVKDDLDTFQTRRYAPWIEIMRWIQRWTVRAALVVIAPSDYLKNIIIGWRVSEKRVRRIYNGIEFPIEFIEPGEKPFGKVIVSVGRLVPWKGFKELISVVALEKDWYLVIVGDGPQEKDLRAHADTKGILDRVTFTGALPRKEMLGWCKNADVFVLNSAYEGLSHTLVEVMGLKTPVVATSVGGNPEVITDLAEGILVEVGNEESLRKAIRYVFEHPEESELHAERAFRKAHEFSLDNTIKGVMEVLNYARSQH